MELETIYWTKGKKIIIITEAFREIVEIWCLYSLMGCWETERKENRKLMCVMRIWVWLVY